MPLGEIDIWRTAKILLDAHGENAWLEAAQRADGALEDGNPEGVTVWKRVLHAIRQLQQSERQPNEAIN
jgi:hypothetical protein